MPFSKSLKVTSSPLLPHVCDRTAYGGILLPQNSVMTNSSGYLGVALLADAEAGHAFTMDDVAFLANRSLISVNSDAWAYWPLCLGSILKVV